MCQAQTKLYLNMGVACPIANTLNANWNVTGGNAYLMMKPVKDLSTVASFTSNNTGAAAVRKLIIRTFTTEPLAAQTIASGSTISGQIRGNMSSVTSRSGQGWIYMRVLNQDGTVNAEIGNVSTTSYTTTLTNRTYSFTLASNVVLTAGMRITFEIGWNYQTGTNTATNSTNSYGSSAASDLAVDNTTTTANNPWVQFSQTLIFQRQGFF